MNGPTRAPRTQGFSRLIVDRLGSRFKQAKKSLCLSDLSFDHVSMPLPRYLGQACIASGSVEAVSAAPRVLNSPRE
jgi:hypothetical protein